MKNTILIFNILIISILCSCRKDKLLEDASVELSFSQDSILYDTVFTSVGSTTRYFRVLNTNNQKINIASIRLARGESSFFRLNVDGVSGKSFSNVEIPANDSIYIFCEVTIDPNNSANPFIYQDSILFETNGNLQDVKLIAFGRNAYFHKPSTTIYFQNGGNFSYGVLNCNEVWNNDKPHVIYGYAVVDSACNLTINAGTEIFIHQNGGLWVYRYGKIQVLGTETNPVLFRHDRLEAEYNDIPGQWDRIWINEGSTGNVINHAIIKNSFIGIQASFAAFDGLNLPGATGTEPKKLKIYNTKIQNCSGIGLLGRYFTIEAGNNIISNCGQQLAVLQYGGSYSFRHCTFANFWTTESRSVASIALNNYTSAQTLPIDSAWFENCIIDGNNTEELLYDTALTNNALNNVKFKNCILKTGFNLASPYYQNVFQNANSSFIDPSVFNFKLNPNSAAINAGTILPNFTLDIEGKPRSDGFPDLGAHEYAP